MSLRLCTCSIILCVSWAPLSGALADDLVPETADTAAPVTADLPPVPGVSPVPTPKTTLPPSSPAPTASAPMPMMEPSQGQTNGEEKDKKDDIVVPVRQDEPNFPDLRRKKYREIHPYWALYLSGSGAALGTQQFGAASRPIAGSVAFEYQPDWAERFGVVSFGPSVSLYPVIPLNTDVPNAESIWSLGFNLRYQFKLSTAQLIVPEAGYSFEELSYHLVAEGDRSFLISGPMIGLELFLNVLDPYNEAELYYNSGLLRSYLVVEGKFMNGSNDEIQISGPSLFFGIRVEF